MLYTREYVKEKYELFNKDLFWGKLPKFDDIEFHITNKKKTFGRGGVTKHIYTSDSVTYEKGYLELSNYYDNTEEHKINVIVHEMCHMYEHICEPQYILDAHKRRRWTTQYPANGHGLIFYREAKRLKDFNGYHFDIARYVSTEGFKSAQLSQDNLDKMSKKNENGIPFIIFKYKNESLGCGYTKVMTQQTLDKWVYDIKTSSYYTKNMSAVCLYYAQNISQVAKLGAKNVSHWFVRRGDTEKVLQDLIAQYDLVSADITYIEDKTSNDMSELVTEHIEAIAEFILSKMQVKTWADEDDGEEHIVLKPFSATYKFDNEKSLKIAFNKIKKYSLVDGNLIIYDFKDKHEWFQCLADDVDIYYNAYSKTEQEEAKEYIISSIVKLIKYAMKNNLNENKETEIFESIMNEMIIDDVNIEKEDKDLQIGLEQFPPSVCED